MKRIIPILLLFLPALVSGQVTQYTAKRIVATDSLMLRDTWIRKITTNLSSADSNSHNMLPTNRAVMDAIRTFGGGGTPTVSGLSAFGRSDNTSGAGISITAAGDGEILRRFGNSLGFGAINLATPAAVSGELPNANIAIFSPWPAQQPFGTIYKKTLWNTNAADWSVSGTASISFAAGVPTITATSVNWSNLVSVIPDRLTMLNQWDDSVDVQLTFTPSAGTTGFGPAIISVNGNITTSYKCYLNTSTSGNGNLILADNNGTTLSSGTGVTNTLNDVIRFWFRLRDSSITISAKNITTGGAYVTASYNIPTTNLAGPFIPNTAKWGFVVHGTGTYKILAVNISSTVTRYANVAFITDSKGISVGAASVGSSWTRTLGNSFPTAVYLCDGGGTLANLISRRDEVFALNPQTAIIAMGCNDKRYGASDATVIERMQTVDGWLRGKGIRTFWTIFPEDSTGGSPGVGLTAIKNWMASNFGSRYIDMWTTMATNSILESAYQADKTHFNQEGSRIADSIIRAGNYLITLDPQRRSAFRTYGPDLTPIGGDSLAFAFKQERRANYINKTDDSLNIVPSLITDNSTTVAISRNHSAIPAPFSGTLLHVNGIATVSGTTGAFIRMDRTNTSNFFANYSNNNVDRFAYNGTDIAYLNNDGSLLLGNQAATGAFLSTFRIKQPKPLSASQNGIALFLNSDSADVTWSAPTGVGNVYFNSFKSQLLTGSNGTPTYDTLAQVLIEKPRVGGTMTGNKIFSLMLRGKMMLGEADSVGSATGGYLFRDFTTGETLLGPGGVTSNIYTANGNLTGNRTLSGAEVYDLRFSGIDTFEVTGFQTVVNGRLSLENELNESIVESSAAVTLSTSVNYVFTGTTETWTLPALASSAKRVYHVKNAGSGNLTVDTAGGNIYDTASQTSITIPAGGARTFKAGTSFWYVFNN